MSNSIIPVVVRGDVATVSSVEVAERTGRQHKSVLRSADRIANRLKNVPIKSDFIRGTYKDKRNRKQRCYFLTVDGFIRLMMNMTGAEMDAIKDAIAERLRSVTMLLQEQGTQEYIECKAEANKYRWFLNDGVKTLAELATEQGSKNGKQYYCNIAKVLNKEVGISSIGEADLATLRKLTWLMKHGGQFIRLLVYVFRLHYKAIYQNFKEYIHSIAANYTPIQA